MRVAMICHFSTQEVRNHLPLSKHHLYRLARKILRLPAKNSGYGDVACWNKYIINAVRERGDIDLYVISAHSGLNKAKVKFDLDGIHYCFVSCEIANFLKIQVNKELQ